MAEEQIDLEQGLAKAAALAEAGKAKEAEEAYAELIEDLNEAWEDASTDAGAEVMGQARIDLGDVDALAQVAERAIAKLEPLASRLIDAYSAQAAFFVKEEQLAKAATALRKAVSHDLDRLPVFLADERFAPLKNHPRTLELEANLATWRGGMSADRAFHDLYMRRFVMGILRHGPDEEHFATLDQLAVRMHEIVLKQDDRKEPSRLTFPEYARLVRLGICLPRKMGGWPYRNSSLLLEPESAKAIHAEAMKRWRLKSKEESGPYYAFMAAITSVFCGQLGVLDELMSYLEGRALFWYRWAVGGLEYTLDGFRESGLTPPGVSAEKARSWYDRMHKTMSKKRLWNERWRAWRGQADAMNFYGVCHVSGWGVAAEPKRALVWYRRAVDKGHTVAALNIADCYMSGIGVEKDEERAFEMLIDLTFDELPEAFNRVGLSYLYARGVEQDHAKAREYFQAAMDKGVGLATESLALMLSRGQGGPRDIPRALELFASFAQKTDPRGYWRITQTRFETRDGDASLRKVIETGQLASEKNPSSYRVRMYVWAAHRLLGEEKAARAFAKTASKGDQLAPWQQLFLRELSKRTFASARFIKRIESDDELSDKDRRYAILAAHFAKGIEAIARGRKSEAEREFKAAIEVRPQGASLGIGAEFELERLKK